MYAYNGQVDRFTKPAPFSLFLSLYLADPAALTTKMILPNVDNIDSPLARQTGPFNRTAVVRWLADKHLLTALRHYKLDHDKRVCFEPTYAPGDYVFVERPPFTAIAAEHLIAEGYSKQILKTMVLTTC